MKRLLKILIVLLVIAASAVLIGRQIWPLPDISDRPADLAIPMNASAGLVKLSADGISANPGKFGVSRWQAERMR